MRKVASLPIALFLLLALSHCQKSRTASDAPVDSVAVLTTDTMASTTGRTMSSHSWDSLDFDLPELTVPKVNLRGNADRGAYTLSDTLLFAFDDAKLSDNGAASLRAIAEDIQERYPTGHVKIYGYADTVGHKAYNKALSEKRAEIVRQYLIGEGKIASDRIHTQAMGERNPASHHPNPLSRRVVIVVRK